MVVSPQLRPSYYPQPGYGPTSSFNSYGSNRRLLGNFPIQPTSHEKQLPTPEEVNRCLTSKQATIEGMKNGLIFGVLGGLPIWGVEKYFKSGNFLQQLAQAVEIQVHPDNLRVTKLLGSSRYNFMASIGGTALVGITAGGALGWWMVSRVRNRLIDIYNTQQEQRQGIFKTAPLSWKQKLGIDEMPVSNPIQAYQEMLRSDLNESQAFQNGMKAVFYFKVLKGLLPLSLLVGCAGVAKLTGNKVLLEIFGNGLNDFIKTLFHPVVLAKMTAIPIIGGFIARQTVPWMRQQLGITNG